jgi:hypothetical protein
MTDITTARDEILSLFKTAWDNSPITNGLPLVFDDSKKEIADDCFARITIQHNTGFQASFGATRFTRLGIVFVQIFTPLGNGLKLSDEISELVLSAFEGKSTTSGVWFRNCRLNEIGETDKWFQTNVVCEFEYDKVN